MSKAQDRALIAFGVPMGLLMVGALISLWASYEAHLGIPVLAALVSGIALYFTVAKARKPMAFAWAALAIGVCVAAYYVFQYRFIPQEDKSELSWAVGHILSSPFPRFGSWAPFPNGVATLLEGLIPLGIGILMSGKSWQWRALEGAAVCMMGLAVLVTASRGAWMGLLAAAAIWLASRWRHGMVTLIVLCLAGAILLGGYLVLVPDPRGSALATLANIPVVGSVFLRLFDRPDRLQVYRGALHLIQDFAITGIGPGGTFGMVYSRYVLLIPHVFLTYSHNLFLAVWLRHGLLGAIGLGWLVTAWIVVVARSHPREARNPLFQGAWVGIVALFVHGLFDARQYVDLWTMWPLFLLLGLMVCTRTPIENWPGYQEEIQRQQEVQRQHRIHHKLPGSLAWSWLWWIVPLLLAAGCLVAWRPLLAMTYANWGAVKQAKAELGALPDEVGAVYLGSAITSYERVLKIAPHNRTARLRLGNLAVAAGRYAEGIAYLEPVWASSPDDATARKALGLACAWTGDVERAAQLLRGSHNIIAELDAWGGWYQQQGQPQLAVYAYQVSLELDPGQYKLREILETLLEDRSGIAAS